MEGKGAAEFLRGGGECPRGEVSPGGVMVRGGVAWPLGLSLLRALFRLRLAPRPLAAPPEMEERWGVVFGVAGEGG